MERKSRIRLALKCAAVSVLFLAAVSGAVPLRLRKGKGDKGRLAAAGTGARLRKGMPVKEEGGTWKGIRHT